MVTKKLSDGSGIYDEYFLGFGVGDADEREAGLVRDVCFGFFFRRRRNKKKPMITSIIMNTGRSSGASIKNMIV